MKLHIATFVLSLVAVSGCDPTWNRGAAVRRTLDGQAAGFATPEDVRTRAAKARATLASWQTDLALRLDESVSETEREIGRAYSIAGKEDLACSQAIQLFASATEMITRSAAPMDRDGVGSVEDLLAKSAELARGAGDRATATSPQNSLKALRKHQSDGSQYASEPRGED